MPYIYADVSLEDSQRLNNSLDDEKLHLVMHENLSAKATKEIHAYSRWPMLVSFTGKVNQDWSTVHNTLIDR